MCKHGLIYTFYKLAHPGVSEEKIPVAYKRSIIEQVWHSIRKWICQVLAPNCVTNQIRILLYRICGFKIGKNTFIGMKCYLDDLCVENIEIGNNVTISYGVFFACHGRKQGHKKLVIKDNAYIGMRASIVARNDMEIGESSIVGANSLVNKSIPMGKTAVGIPCRIID